ncbi:Uncharacterised protein [Pseudomonas aeruginosa]|nr:Uncharacterised protein [Pseudomonas aeruginosa]
MKGKRWILQALASPCIRRAPTRRLRIWIAWSDPPSELKMRSTRSEKPLPKHPRASPTWFAPRWRPVITIRGLRRRLPAVAQPSRRRMPRPSTGPSTRRRSTLAGKPSSSRSSALPNRPRSPLLQPRSNLPVSMPAAGTLPGSTISWVGPVLPPGKPRPLCGGFPRRSVMSSSASRAASPPCRSFCSKAHRFAICSADLAQRCGRLVVMR